MLTGSLQNKNELVGNMQKPNSVGGNVSPVVGNLKMTTDETLTVKGKAADAKATGDRFEIVESNINNLSNEVGNASILLSLI